MTSNLTTKELGVLRKNLQKAELETLLTGYGPPVTTYW
jgi:hypothetical protein